MFNGVGAERGAIDFGDASSREVTLVGEETGGFVLGNSGSFEVFNRTLQVKCYPGHNSESTLLIGLSSVQVKITVNYLPKC